MKFTYFFAFTVAVSAANATIIPHVKGRDYDGYDTYDTYDTSGISDSYDTSGVSDGSDTYDSYDTYVDTSTPYDTYSGQVYTQPVNTGTSVTTYGNYVQPVGVVTTSPPPTNIFSQLIAFLSNLLGTSVTGSNAVVSNLIY